MGKVITLDELPYVNFKKEDAKGGHKVHYIRAGDFELFPYECEGEGWGDATRVQQEFVKNYLCKTHVVHLGLGGKVWHLLKNFYLDFFILTPYYNYAVQDPIPATKVSLYTWSFNSKIQWSEQLPPLTDVFTREIGLFLKEFKIKAQLNANFLDWQLLLKMVELENFEESSG